MSVWSIFLAVPYLSLTRRKLIHTQISCFSRFFQISENVSITFTDEFSYQLTSEGKRNHFCALNLFCSVICHVSHTEPDRNSPAREWWTVMGFLLLNGKIWISNSKHRCLSYYQAVLPHQAFLILVIFFLSTFGVSMKNNNSRLASRNIFLPNERGISVKLLWAL